MRKRDVDDMDDFKNKDKHVFQKHLRLKEDFDEKFCNSTGTTPALFFSKSPAFCIDSKSNLLCRYFT